MSAQQKHRYSMKIERQVVDKLGLKLYDKVSAVVAELIANAYDADAENVTVRVPLGKALAVRKGDSVEQKDFIVEVSDDGHGMTPEEADDFYLRVGKDRRLDLKRGDNSRGKSRPVMGRKGIGKLSPFGVCGVIEVRSAGGKKTDKGYEVSHFELDYQKIIDETDEDNNQYHPHPLEDDGKFDEKPGTTIRLKTFLPRLVPDRETFGRQIAYRFLPLPDFAITVEDTKSEDPESPFTIGSEEIDVSSGTKVIVDDRPLIDDENVRLPVTGWIGMAKQSHKNNEMAGVRIYARGKIAAITRDFGSPAGFTGEFVARSYLVGEIHADWLDEGEDMIQTHRQDILWSTERGQAFSEWGQEILREVAKKGREPRREKVRETFMEVSNLRSVAKKRFDNPDIEKAAIDIGEKIGGFASEDELGDKDYVDGLSEIILSVAPHKLLVDTFRRIEQMAKGDGKIDLKELVKLFDTSRIAQLASFGQIVSEKIQAIDLLEKMIQKDGATEDEYQKILEDAPWLIDPRWIPVTANQSLKTFRSEFESWYKKEYGDELLTTTQIEHSNKRPDFIMLSVNSQIVVVEIKPPKHTFGDADYVRLQRYHDAMEAFFEKNQTFKTAFPNGHKIILVCDSEKLSSTEEKALTMLRQSHGLETFTWTDLLHNTKLMHQQYLDTDES